MVDVVDSKSTASDGVPVRVRPPAPKLDTSFDTMRIKAGVQFLFAKAPICKGFPIPFNENRLYSDSETVAAEPVAFCLSVPFNERSVGCAFLSQGVCTF